MSRPLAIVAEMLERRMLLSVSLLKDINAGDLGSNPSQITAAGSGVIFEAENGSQIWVSDGSAAGTALVPGLTMLAEPGTFNGEAYFVANSQSSGTGLWKSDGSVAGTVPVGINLTTGAGNLVPAGDRFYFVAAQGSPFGSIWSSDGTAPGTRQVFNFPPNLGLDFTSISNSNQVHFELAASNAKTCFVLRDNTSTVRQVWASDGTPAGTHLLVDNIGEHQALVTAAADGTFYIFVASGPKQGLYKSDGTPAGTTLLTTVGGAPTFQNQLAVVGNEAFFSGDDDTNGTQLWESDGTVSGTQMVFIIDQGASLQFDNFTAVNGVLIFDVADSRTHEMWYSDGTALGSGRLHQFIEPRGGWPPITVVGNEAYFAADDGTLGLQLWKTDGTSQHTQLVRSVNPVGTSNPVNLGAGNDHELFLSADDGIHGAELWKSDGTAVGTQLVKNIDTRPASSTPLDPIDVGGTLFFTATDQFGRQVWKSDGTAAGTVRVTNLNPDETGTGMNTSQIQNLTNFNGAVYFTTGAGNLWKTNGTQQGTSEVLAAHAIFGPAPNTGPIFDLTVSGNLLFFTEINGANLELWRTDGSPAGTFDVASWPNLYPGSPRTAQLTPLAGGVVFQATSGSTPQVWHSDGTFAGTGPLTNIPPIPSTAQYGLVNLLGSSGIVGNTLYFLASETWFPAGATQNVTVHDLWKTDGTPAGTVRLVQNFPLSPTAFYDLGGTAEFFGTAGGAAALWSLDPNTGAASVVAQVPAVPSQTVRLGSKLYFFPGAALWVTDGTAAGTQQVALLPSGLPSAPSEVAAGDGLLFIDDQGLFRSDGTAAGTTEISSTLLPSFPPVMLVSGNRLYFSATQASVGNELFTADASISGRVYTDENRNGLLDSGEPGIAGVTVYLDANSNGTLDAGEASTITDANGNFAFGGVAPGNYVLRQVLPAGDVQTSPAPTTVSATIGSNAARTFGDVPAVSVPLNFDALLLLARNYGKAGTFADGDLNGDGMVNFEDLLLLARNYAQPGAASSVVSAARRKG